MSSAITTYLKNDWIKFKADMKLLAKQIFWTIVILLSIALILYAFYLFIGFLAAIIFFIFPALKSYNHW